MLIKKSQTILKRFICLKFSIWFTLRAQKMKAWHFVTLRTFSRSTAGQDFQNTKWPAVGKRKEERGIRKEEGARRKLKKKEERGKRNEERGRRKEERGKRNKERGRRKEEGGKTKEERGSWKKFQVSQNMVSFSEPSGNQTLNSIAWLFLIAYDSLD